MFLVEAWEKPYWERGPSEHLTWRELCCNDGTPYPEEWRRTKAVVLATEFERIRAHVSDRRHEDTPIMVGSGFRTRQWNTDVKGARDSRHVTGEAVDMWTPRGLELAVFADLVLDVVTRPDSTVRGVGIYPWGVHVDIRGFVIRKGVEVVNAARVYRWRGARVRPEIWSNVLERLDRSVVVNA